MSNWIATLILPAWVLVVINNFWLIATSAIVGYLIGKEGGLWQAAKRFSVLIVLATTVVAIGAYVGEKLPQWTQAARAMNTPPPANGGWGLFRGGE